MMKNLFFSLMLILGFFSSSVESIIIKERIYVKRIDFSGYDCFYFVTKESHSDCDYELLVDIDLFIEWLFVECLFMEWLSRYCDLNYSANIKIDCIKRCLEKITDHERGEVMIDFIEYIDVTIQID